jgi:hypothetical protein
VQLAWLTEASWLDRQRLDRYPKILVVVFTAAASYWLWSAVGLIDPAGKPVGSDFITFFAASSLALDGEAAAIFDGAILHAAERAAIGGGAIDYFAWYYPPTFLMVVLPLALLPYGWALAAWLASTLVGYLAVLRHIAPAPASIWLAVAFPAVLINAGNGQNGFLTTALMGGALLLLDRRPLAAGALFAALAIKPQLAILVPFILMAGARWRALAVAAACYALGIAVAWAMFGSETFTAFLANTGAARAMLESGAVGWHKLQSVFAGIRMMGGGIAVSYVAQACVAMAATAVAMWIWRQPTSLPVKASAFVSATLLSTPFFYDYDLVLLALPIAWLGWEGHREGFHTWEKTILVLAWIWPLIARQSGLVLGAPLTPLIIAGLLGLAIRRAARAEVLGACSPRLAEVS